MEKKLRFGEYITIASMLFGLFFGAGNLIFPASMGQLAGHNVWQAIGGFLITGVGLPLLAVAALGVSRCGGLAELSSRVSRGYGMFFTCALYLTIGPFFAIPRCATVSFTVGVQPLLGEQQGAALPLLIFSLLFFGAALWFSLRPSNILTWVGKVLNPLFLACLGILVITALLRPAGAISAVEPQGAYAAAPFSTGFLEGYNTMDALAGLAFGIIVVNVVRGLGVRQPGAVAASTVKAGVFSSVIMAAIYIAITLVGAQSRGAYPASANGGEALAVIARHYFGTAGGLILALTVTFACLKTSVGLITSCGETFKALFPGRFTYKVWAIGFCTVSFLIANVGLNAILNYSLPVLMFLYPLAITLILLTLLGKVYQNDGRVYRWVTGFTLAAALFDFAKSLAGAQPAAVSAALHLDAAVEFAGRWLPLFGLGLGWVCPAAVGFVIGFVLHKTGRGAARAN